MKKGNKSVKLSYLDFPRSEVIQKDDNFNHDLLINIYKKNNKVTTTSIVSTQKKNN